MSHTLNRRTFIQTGSVLTASAMAGTMADIAWAQQQAQENPVRLAIVGVNGRGAANMNGCAAHGQVVALCDVDTNRATAAQRRFPQARFYQDYRQMLEQDNIEAVVVSTPDHTHAVVACAAMRAGKHVYCEKPLAHSVHEVRTMMQLAARHNVKTQMGTQIHAGDNYRRVVEIIQAGTIGPVRNVKVWVNRSPDPGMRAAERTNPPRGLDYDLWLGPAPYRHYHPSHLHFNWRWWWDFGGGVLADMACHFMDLPHWALNLRTPTRVTAEGRVTHQAANRTPSLMQVNFEYAARGDMPPVTITWYHGAPRPSITNNNVENYGFTSGVLFEGERGNLAANYGSYRLLPENRFRNFTPPQQSIARSIGHHREWVHAIRNNGNTTCNFDYSGSLALTVLLGNVSYRCDEAIVWDNEAGRVTNTRTAGQYLRREYRDGWRL